MRPSRDHTGANRSTADPAHRARRFLARVDCHLPTLPTGSLRRAFLDRLIAGWQERYARFIASHGRSEPATRADPPQAADFLITIAALAARRCALGRRRGGDDA